MYFQFLTEDKSTKILINHVMEKIKTKYSNKDVLWDIKFFNGIGHLLKKGTPIQQKTGKLLNDLPMYLRAFDKVLQAMGEGAIFVVMDNDKRDNQEFQSQLKKMAQENMILSDLVFCIAVKEMEAWLLGDISAVEKAYPDFKRTSQKRYIQDGICDTWEVLADMVYPGGLKKLKKTAGYAYSEIGKAKAEWADKIGAMLNIENNKSPSFQFFIKELIRRVEVA